MLLDKSLRFTKPANVLVKHVRNECLLLNSQTEMYFSLNATGSYLFNMLCEGCRLSEAIAAVEDKYQPENTDVEVTCLEVVKSLLDRGLLETQKER